MVLMKDEVFDERRKRIFVTHEVQTALSVYDTNVLSSGVYSNTKSFKQHFVFFTYFLHGAWVDDV